MAHIRKIKAGGVNIALQDFVGENGTLFYDPITGELRVSDGHTPGGIPVAVGPQGEQGPQGEHGTGTIVQGSTPPPSDINIIWYDTVSGRIFTYFGGAWVDASPDTVYNLAIATSSILGGVKIDGVSMDIDSQGVISAKELVNGIYSAALTNDGVVALGTAKDQAGAYTDVALQIDSDVNSFAQVIFQNHNTGTTASTDFVIMNDQGDDFTSLIDIGINSSNYATGEYAVQSAGSGYVFVNGGDLTIGTQTPGKRLVFHAGGTTSTNSVGSLDEYGWTFNRQIIVSDHKDGPLTFTNQNTSGDSNANTLFQGQNDNNSYFQLGILSTTNLGYGPRWSPSDVFLSANGSGETLHIGGQTHLNFYADQNNSNTGVPALAIDRDDQSSTFDGNVLPYTDATYDLGSTSTAWRNLHIGTTGSIFIGDTAITVTNNSLQINGTDISSNQLGNLVITGTNLQTVSGIISNADIVLDPAGTGTVVVNSNLHLVTGSEFSIGGAMMKATDGQFELASDIVPATNNTVSLGTTDLRWKEVWIGPGTLVITDETMGTDVIVTARDNNFVVEGTSGLKVGSFQFLDNALTFGTPTEDISIGLPESTGVIKFNRGVEIISGATDTVSFKVDREGLTSLRTPNVGPTEAAFSINSSLSGGTQLPLNRGTMIQITGIDDMPNRISADTYGFSNGTNSYINFAARAARGSSSAPTATQANDLLFRLSANGWGDTGFASVAQGIAQINFLAEENFTDNIHGTRIEVRTTEIGQGTGRVNTIFNSTGVVLPDASNGITFGDSTRQTTAWTSTATVNYSQVTGSPTLLSQFENDTNFISTVNTSTADFGNIQISGNTVENTVHGNDLMLKVEGNGSHVDDGNVDVTSREFHVHTGGNDDAVFKIEATGQTRILTPTFDSAKGAFSIVGSVDNSVVSPQNPGVMAHLTGQSATPSRIYNDGAANYSAYIGRRYNGTSASPTHVLDTEIISRIGATPYIDGDTNWPTISTSRIDFVANGDQSATNFGNKIEFYTASTGTTSTTKDITIDSHGITFRDGTSQDTAAIPLTYIGQANGVVPLNSSTKIDTSYLPAGSTVFKGGWDATTNTPALSDTLPAGVQAGWEYIVTVGGTRDIGNGSEVWTVGDLVIYDGANWLRIPAGDSGVSTFNGRTGAVSLTATDVTSALSYTPYNGTINPNGYVNSSQASAAAPVQTVYGRAGNVTPTSSEILGSISTASISNAKLANSSITIGSGEISLGATTSTLAGLTSVAASLFSAGALTYSDTGILTRLQSSTNSYTQLIIQNSNTGSSASANLIVNNDQSTAGSFYGQFGMNSSNFTGAGAYSAPGAVYLTSVSTDLAIGTVGANSIRFFTNNGSTDAMSISSAGVLTVASTIQGSVSGNAGTVTNGVYTNGTYANPSWITSLAYSKLTGTPTSLSEFSNTVTGYITTASLSVTTAASGTSALSYFNGVITFTPPNLSSYATQSYVTSQGYITTASLASYATQSYVTSQGYITTASLASYATQSYVTSQGYTTTATVNTLIANSLTNYATQSYVTSQGYITTSSLSVTTAASGTNALSYNNGVFTFTPQNLSLYATQSWVQSQGYSTSTGAAGVTSITGGANIVLSTSTGAVSISRVDGLQSLITNNSSSTYTLSATDQYFGTTRPSTGATTITLPLGSTVPDGRQYIIKDEAGNAGAWGRSITIARSGSDLIDGTTSRTINSNYGSLTVMWTGTKWSRI